ncbi:sensor domain-containing diguanylate cyclase [Simiduia agarivorans]|uniref:Response regulator n=1 Tax=Simiduia agarivorans (strain DSM 21679 / JCM 13881 / BCRC 17597 / SA1) TaxID=1117647 RepID=K4KJS5_SIMAS|nr:sensor domain-containing diguanylate cyclase [Simiduia agarivorans]AFU99231.1 response regulator [Simiduia agarivorans SA1 = DSM 21679]
MNTGTFKQVEQVGLLKLLEHANIGVVIHTADTAVIYANPTALRLLKLTYAQMIGKDALDPQWKFIDPDGVPLPLDQYPVNRVKHTGKAIHDQVLEVVDSQHRDISWFSVNAYPEGKLDSNNGFIIVSFTDITDRKSQFSFADILHNTQDVVLVTEADNIKAPFGPRIVYVNKAFESLTGYTADEVIGETPRILQGKDTDAGARKRIFEALEARQPCRQKILNYSKTGTPYWLDLSIFPLKNRYGEVTHFAAIERDITQATHYSDMLEQRNADLKLMRSELEQLIDTQTQELKQKNSELHRLAYEDYLTGLPNRKAFFQLAESQLARMQRQNCTLCVAILDIDHFKAINDQHGHDAGDRALILAAKILRDSLRTEDAFGRLGGEEFAIASLANNQQEAVHVLERLRANIESLTHSLASGGFTCSIGYCTVTTTQLDSISNLLQRADSALYEAKHAGRNRLVGHTA